jgi:IS5 family transposase
VVPSQAALAVWADSAYRSRANETWLDKAGKLSRLHQRKPRGKPKPRATSRANAEKSKIRARVEHVYAEQKSRMGLVIRTIGLARAEATITLANMAYNMKRWCWLDSRGVSA